MGSLTLIERDAVAAAQGAAMLSQVEAWALVNSGSRNLAGLADVAALLGDAFAALPGELVWREPTPVDAVDAAGQSYAIEHGRNLHLTVRPEAPVQLLLTGHMDTVFGADHAFQSLTWLEPGVLGGPGVADMKGGIAVMLAALKALESSRRSRTASAMRSCINSDEEVGSPGSAALIAEAARGKRAALTYEPAALPDGTLAGARPGSGNFSFVIAGRRPMPGAIPRTAATRSSPRPTWRCGWPSGEAAAAQRQLPRRSTAAGRTMSCPTCAVLRVNMRPATAEDQARAQSLIDAAVAMVAAAA